MASYFSSGSNSMIVDRYRIEASNLDLATPQPGIGETILQTAKGISKTPEKT